MKKFTLLFALAALAGCASPTPNYDAKFGDAVREARLAMTINPEANKNKDPATGMDGKAARATILLYQGTFMAPPPVTNVINISGSANGAK
jgi:hypothetical protein